MDFAFDIRHMLKSFSIFLLVFKMELAIECAVAQDTSHTYCLLYQKATFNIFEIKH